MTRATSPRRLSAPGGRHGRPTRFPRWPAPTAFAIGVLGVWAIIIHWLAPDLLPSITGAGFLDPSSRTKELASACRRLDAGITRAIEIVAPGTRVLNEHEKHNVVNGVRWVSRRVEFQLPPAADAARVAHTLTNLPFDHRWAITSQTFQVEPYSETIQFAVRGYPTHLVTLYDALTAPDSTGVGPGEVPRVAILIDDLGYHPSRLSPLWTLKAPFSVSILPFTPYALIAAETAYSHQKEVLVHMPTEPLPDLTNPRRRAVLGQLTLSMPLEEIRRRTLRALRAVPYAVGVNNHEGSAFMRSARHVRAFLEVVKQERLFFVDSRTTTHSQGLPVARSIGLPATDRQVFLDNDPAPHRIRQALERLKEIAARRGYALGIGHPHRSTVEVLAQWLPVTAQERIRLVPVSALTGLQDDGVAPAQEP